VVSAIQSLAGATYADVGSVELAQEHLQLLSCDETAVGTLGENVHQRKQALVSSIKHVTNQAQAIASRLITGDLTLSPDEVELAARWAYDLARNAEDLCKCARGTSQSDFSAPHTTLSQWSDTIDSAARRDFGRVYAYFTKLRQYVPQEKSESLLLVLQAVREATQRESVRLAAIAGVVQTFTTDPAKCTIDELALAIDTLNVNASDVGDVPVVDATRRSALIAQFGAAAAAAADTVKQLLQTGGHGVDVSAVGRLVERIRRVNSKGPAWQATIVAMRDFANTAVECSDAQDLPRWMAALEALATKDADIASALAEARQAEAVRRLDSVKEQHATSVWALTEADVALLSAASEAAKVLDPTIVVWTRSAIDAHITDTHAQAAAALSGARVEEFSTIAAQAASEGVVYADLHTLIRGVVTNARQRCHGRGIDQHTGLRCCTCTWLVLLAAERLQGPRRRSY
jgi:hypothetical protein